MEISGFPAGPYQTNCYVVSDNGHAFVVDPGMHSFDRVVAATNSLQIDAVFLTHGHFDHTRCAGNLAKEFDIPVYIHAADEFWLGDTKGLPPQMQMLFDVDNMVPIADLRTLGTVGKRNEPGTVELLGREFSTFHAPGHSPGCLMLQAENILFSGDVLFRGAIGRTDLPFSDPQAMDATLREVVMNLPDELQVLPGHGPTTTVRYEKATNPFLAQLNG
ncbi:MBL fold metallo-hydrolase [Corynebacterium sp.]|uniref:MBL fold metallo-hydrolase n=1 Tax=Corynebacterium sp. TaxID=1720 RepID=UPI0027B9779D|nr:MBL fold metallo-hydrolase [Corynebacterium sp.]